MCVVQFTFQSRNFGFVVYASAADAAKLVAPDAPAEALEMDGRKLNIRYAEALGQAGRVGRGGEPPRGLYGDPARADYRDRDQERREREQGRQPPSGDFKVFVGHLGWRNKQQSHSITATNAWQLLIRGY